MVKLIDIAKQLNLSRVTVSSVLNDRYKSLGISEATAERVRNAAKEMGYRRNEMAMAMKTGKNFLLGCMTGALGDEWGGRILDGALQVIRESDYSLKVEAVHCTADEEEALQRFLGARVSGIFACNINPKLDAATHLCQQLQRYEIPMVCNNCRPDLSPYRVDPDNEGGSDLAVRHLAEIGHKLIAFIGGDDQSIPGRQRREGFIDALGACGLSLAPKFLEQGNWDIEKTEAAVHRLLEQAPKRPTAIVCANDVMAAVAIREIHRMGLRVPEDVSVVGFTNEGIGEVCHPPLTTIAQPELEIGRRAMKMLIQKVEEKAEDRKKPETLILPSELIIRSSTIRRPSKRARKAA